MNWHGYWTPNDKLIGHILKSSYYDFFTKLKNVNKLIIEIDETSPSEYSGSDVLDFYMRLIKAFPYLTEMSISDKAYKFLISCFSELDIA